MRRSDREIVDAGKINEIIRACDCCRLGFVDGDSAYIVPLNFGFEEADGKRFFYFHGAKEGKKISLTKSNPNVGFELDTNHAVNAGEKACNYSFRYQSVIGKGKIALVEDVDEKKSALCCIMRHYSDKTDWAFTDGEVSAIAIMKLEVTELACKEHK
jgi:nitroimidazol reductase NimA-like FMN-containing flavoprotein (pyridoxamine 5'-phosphate oxidase superfamily)